MRVFWLRAKWFLWNLCIDLCLPVPSVRWVLVGRDIGCLRPTNAECDELDRADRRGSRI